MGGNVGEDVRGDKGRESMTRIYYMKKKNSVKINKKKETPT